MWRHMARIIGEVRPRFAFVENSPMLTSRGLGHVLGDLASLGYDARWGVLGAYQAGAPHRRDRIWIVAYANGGRWKIGHNQRAKSGNNQETNHAFSRGEDVPDSYGDAKHDQSVNAKMAEPSELVADTNGAQCNRKMLPGGGKSENPNPCVASSWWGRDPSEIAESGVGRMAHGVAARMDRLKAIGNGQVPDVAALAWRVLTAELDSA